jgi:triacylglycerol lipase
VWRGKLKKKSWVVRGAFEEVFATLVAANLYPFGIIARDPEGGHHSTVAANPCPILLLHGIIHNRSAFLAHKRRMQKLGWENIYTLNYRTFHGSLFQMVDDLDRRIQSIRHKTKAARVDIVAHSLGGLVARMYMSIGAGRDHVRRLVTLGTPHQGTRLSFLAKGLARGALDQDLKVNSYLIRLLSQTRLPAHSQIVSIYSPFDWTVVPGENAAAVGVPSSQIRNIRLEKTIGHAGLLYRYEAFDAIVKALLS